MTSIGRALAIEGWMTEAELAWLAFQAVTHRCIVEIGSYLGRSTRVLADNTPGKVYAIDDWYGPRDTTWLDADRRAGLYEEFLKNIAGTQVIPIRADHGQVVILSETPDMVFIDGDHEYESVRRDIGQWRSRVRGLLCGHDADKVGVRRAVQEAFGAVTIAPETMIWYVEV